MQSMNRRPKTAFETLKLIENTKDFELKALIAIMYLTDLPLNQILTFDHRRYFIRKDYILILIKPQPIKLERNNKIIEILIDHIITKPFFLKTFGNYIGKRTLNKSKNKYYYKIGKAQYHLKKLYNGIFILK